MNRNFNYIELNKGLEGLDLHKTPLVISNNMISLLDDKGFFDKPSASVSMEEYINTHRVLDIYCKSGNLLKAVWGRFMIALRDVFPDKDERDYFIVKYLLYGFCPSLMVRNAMYDLFYSNSKYDLSKEIGNFFYYDIISGEGFDRELAEEVLNLKFDLIVGNPPYNDDIYLDFVTLGHKLAKSYSLWITPAKFMGSPSNKNVKFRRKMLNKISSIVYYPESYDIFDVLEACGICYYLIDKNIHSDIEVTNKSEFMPVFNTGMCKRDITRTTTLLNVGAEIIEKLSKNRFTFKEYNGRYKVWVTNMPGYGGGSTSKHFFSNNKNAQVIQRYEILDDSSSYSAKQAKVVFSSDNINECESFVSYLYSKFVRFLVYCGFCTTAPLNDATFRFVPDQGSFDKIYEDKPLVGYTPDENGEYKDASGIVHCSLYIKYKLTDEEINIIEAVIRERK